MNTGTVADVRRRLLGDPLKSWVLFEHGTCVVLTAPDGAHPSG
ncbi:hypothetical protein RB196_19525 [Streptomyces sp. PmtA]